MLSPSIVAATLQHSDELNDPALRGAHTPFIADISTRRMIKEKQSPCNHVTKLTFQRLPY